MATNKKEYKVKIQIGGEKDSSLDKAFSQTKRELDNLYRFSKRTNQSFLSSVNKMDAFADKTFSFMAKGAAAYWSLSGFDSSRSQLRIPDEHGSGHFPGIWNRDGAPESSGQADGN